MDMTAFRDSLAAPAPPSGLTAPLEALWHAAKGDWNRAHDLCQKDEGRAAARVHAYLHRFEGDHSNAGYWYRRAGRPVSDVTLDAEWSSIAGILLAEP